MHPVRMRGATALVLVVGTACRSAPVPGPLLSIEEARRSAAGSEVRVRAVLGLYDDSSHTGYLHGGGAALYFEAAQGALVPAAGSDVEVEGVVEHPGSAHRLRARHFRLAALPPSPGLVPERTPEPKEVPAEALADPALEGAWVTAEGVVARVEDRGRAHSLHLEAEGASFTACIGEPYDRPMGRRNLAGYTVRAQGVRVSPADARASSAGCTLLLPNRTFLRLLRDAPLADAPPPPPLTAIDGIRALFPDEAQQHRPVRVRGVVTTYDPDRNLLFVQDRTAGIYVEAWRHVYEVCPGDFVDVTGWTDRGAFAPIIVWPRLRVLGRAPYPRPVRLTAAIVPRHDGQWVEIDGVVRAARRGRRRALIDLMAFGERLRVDLPGLGDLTAVQALVDAEVRVRGVYKAQFSATRQLLGAGINVTGLENVSVLSNAPADPYASPVRRSDTVLDFDPGATPGRRVHVRGVVTLRRPGRFLYLRDAGGPLLVHSAGEAALAPGDEIDVLGFPGLGEHRPVLLDASYRLRGRQPPPEPRPVEAGEAMGGSLDGELLRIEGRLIDRLGSEDESQLLLQTPMYVFQATLPGPGGPELERLRPGSRVRVSGIGVARGRAAGMPQILLRSAGDVLLVESAPWWTPRRAALAMAALVAVAGGALVWVGALRRLVRQQTAVLRRRLTREAALEERTRLARELHDTLEQNLAGIGYALEAVKQTIEHPQVARAHLERALSHVDRSMGEARRSVWALRPQALQHRDLVSALEALVGEFAQGGVAHPELHVDGEPWPVPPALEDQLFRIAQEALTNAQKHAGARRVSLALQFGEEALTLEVRDDGRGFDQKAPAVAGHFGLAGMLERAATVGGTLDVKSGPGCGTAVVVAVPRRRAALPQVS